MSRRLPDSLVRVGALAAKEALHIRRDPRTLYLGLFLPLIMLLLFGFGVSFDIDHIPLAVADQDRTAESRALLQDFVAAHEFELKGALPDPDRATRIMAAHRATAVLVIPPGYAEALARGDTATVALLLDASDPHSAQQSLARADVMAQVATARVAAASGLLAGGGDGLPLSARTWTRFNPAGRSALYLVPGVTAYVLALVAVLLTSLAVAREWERGSMEQLFATPVGRLEIVVGKLLPYLAMGVVQVLLVMTAGAWVFGLPFRGSLWLLSLASVLFMLGMLGQGLLISVIARNQMVATQASMLSAMLPSMLLSGFMFPIENMPGILQFISHIVPARYYIAILRGVLLKGNGLAELHTELLLLGIFAVVMVAVSTARFKRKLA
ncbi:MAG: ABC transporter permease [Deltaproteobacteria bacterium]|nr:MAG: ABC transporter permease [Deltaproteobacteria bacterium]